MSTSQQMSTHVLIGDEVDFDAYTETELLRLKEELAKKNDFLDVENRLFESYYHRVVSPVREDSLNGNFDLKDTPGSAGDREDKGDRDDRSKKKLRNPLTAALNSPVLLTPDQKSEIATRELEELRDEIDKTKEEWNKTLDNYKAEMEELDTRIGEGKKAMYEFKRDIVCSAVNTRTGKIIAERLVRYIEEKIRMKETIIEKTRLKNSTLKNHKNKLHLQLKQKEEMGEVLHAIDFDQLQIENKQYLAKIEERNNELLKLKMTASKTVQVLNYYKQKLAEESQIMNTLTSDIRSRQDILKKLDAESATVEKDKSRAESQFTAIKNMLEEVRVPSVMSYVELKAQQHDFSKKLKSWERKCEIASMQLRRIQSLHKQLFEKDGPAGMATKVMGNDNERNGRLLPKISN